MRLLIFMSIVECLLYVCELDIAEKSKRILLYFFQLMRRLEGGMKRLEDCSRFSEE